MPKTVKTPKNIQFVEENYLKMTSGQLAEAMGISKSGVGTIMRHCGLKISKELREKRRIKSMRKPITDEEVQYIHAHIGTDSIKKMSRDLKRTSALISDTAHALGYSELIQKNAADSRLKKGHIPANKGRKQEDYMTPQQIARTAKTRFKKGQKPHNTLSDGEITIRHDNLNNSYKWIRIAEGEWQPLHRHVWEEHNGPLKKGMNVVFKDGNTLNCALSNLEAVSHAELMRRNSIHNYPTEFKTTFKLISKIKRKIKDHE